MRIVFHRGFKKYYRKLKSGERRKFDERIHLFEKDPYHPILNNHALKDRYQGYRSVDITGDLRALYEPRGKEIAFFIIVDTHSNLYG